MRTTDLHQSNLTWSNWSILILISSFLLAAGTWVAGWSKPGVQQPIKVASCTSKHLPTYLAMWFVLVCLYNFLHLDKSFKCNFDQSVYQLSIDVSIHIIVIKQCTQGKDVTGSELNVFILENLQISTKEKINIDCFFPSP